MDQDTNQTPPTASTQQPSPSGPTPPPPAPTPMDVLPNTSPPPLHIPKMLAVILLCLITVVLIFGGFGTYKYFTESTKTISPNACPRMDCEFGCKEGKCLSPSPTSSPDPTANWKTYINSAVGFAIEYPARLGTPKLPAAFDPTDATGRETDATVIFGESSEYSFSVTFFPFTGTSEELLKSDQATGLPPYTWSKSDRVETTRSSLTISGQEAVFITAKLFNENDYFYGVFLTYDGYGYIIHARADINKEDFNQILSTFKFTDAVSPPCTPRPAICDNPNVGAYPKECAIEPTGGWCPTSATECKRGGCSGQICQEASEEPLASTCEFKEEYACYRSALCERQSDGKCGWTKTQELTSCLAEAR